MLKFQKQVNDMENILGVYISTNQIDSLSMVIVKYFLDLFTEKSFFRSPLKSPIIMLYDPYLRNNKLDIKVSQYQEFKTNTLFVFIDFEHSFILLQGLPSFQWDATQI